MYSLEEKKAIPFKEKLQSGEIFLKYESKSDKILYLANLKKKKVAPKPGLQAKSLSIQKIGNEDSSDCESLIKLKLDDDVKQ